MFLLSRKFGRPVALEKKECFAKVFVKMLKSYNFFSFLSTSRKVSVVEFLIR